MSIAERALAALLLCLALVGGGYYWGANATSNSHAAAELKQVRADASEFKREVSRGQQASEKLQADNKVLNANYTQLERAFNVYKKSHPLLIARRPAEVPAAQDAPKPNSPAAAAVADPVLELSAGAVWMWNSALAGVDRPVGACGLADQSEGSCDVGAGVSVEDAWANQATNAKLCAEDRQRHQHLIDFIQQRQKHAN